MKIYIAVDMEGISGINSPDYVLKDGKLYSAGQRLATEDVNAAVAGAFDGGADTVVVADVHGSSGNLLIEQIDSRALIMAGAPRFTRFPFLDSSFAGLALIGYHAMAGTELGNLEHTMNSRSWFRYCVNGVPYGEVSIDAEIAATCGVPVIMTSGDDLLCEESKRVIGPEVETACVKLGTGRQSALCLSPEAGHKRVYAAMKAACEKLTRGEKYPLVKVNAPAVVQTAYKFTPDADAAANQYGARRIDGYTVEMTYSRLAEAYGGLWSEKDGRTTEKLTDN